MRPFRLGWTTVGLLSVAIVAATGALATGEIVRIVSPSAVANAEGNGSLRPNVAPNRLQFFFPSSDFADLPTSQRFLVALNFRADQTQTQAVDRVFPDGEWWMSTTNKTSATLSTVFANNHGPNKTLVHSGLYTQRILGSGSPRDIADGMRFQKPFYYDPSQGNLLIEHIWRTTGSPITQPVLDVQLSPEISLVAGGNPNATSGTLITGQGVTQFEFAAAPPGDFNQDGIVDAADYVVWRTGLGTTYTEADYAVWRTHFGDTAGSGATLPSVEQLTAVPEPSTLALAGLVFLSLFAYRKNKAWELDTRQVPYTVCGANRRWL